MVSRCSDSIGSRARRVWNDSRVRLTKNKNQYSWEVLCWSRVSSRAAGACDGPCHVNITVRTLGFPVEHYFEAKWSILLPHLSAALMLWPIGAYWHFYIHSDFPCSGSIPCTVWVCSLSGIAWPQICWTFVSPLVEPFQTVITLCNGNTRHH